MESSAATSPHPAGPGHGNAAARDHRWPALDGLRAIAILAVMIYHASERLLPSGFLGVDVFFVLSGFLITSLLLEERARTGTVNFKRFYARRALRLLPAALASLLAAIVVASIRSGSLHNATSTSAWAVLAYVANWQIISSHNSLGLLNQFWSLSIEEQFYFVWPVAMLFALGRWRPQTLVALTGIVIGVMCVRMVELAAGSAPGWRIYYGTDTRAVALYFGCALALLWPALAALPPQALRRMPALSFIGVAILLGGAISAANSKMAFAVELPVIALATCALIASVTLLPGASIGPLLSKPPMRYIGAISYGLYLWHPIALAILRPVHMPILHFTLFFLLSFALAAASSRWIEKPFLRLRPKVG